MLARAIRVTLVAFLVVGVGTASYFGGYENGRSVAAIAVSPSTPAPQDGEPADFGVFWEAWQLVEKEFYNQSAIDPTKMTYAGKREDQRGRYQGHFRWHRYRGGTARQ
jgi:hypothetical protein